MKKKKTDIIKKSMTEVFKIAVFAIGILAVSYSIHIIDDTWEADDEILVEGITCDITLKEGQTYKLTPTRDDIRYDKIIWFCDNRKGLGITEEGIVTAKTAGEYMVICQYQYQDKIRTTEEFWIRITN